MDRFNFYDLYGYLIPGLVTLGLLALPFRLVADFKLPSEWSATFVALIVGYVVGHLLQIIAGPVFSHFVNGRQFSAKYLDAEDTTLSVELKAKLAERISREFGIEVNGGNAATLDRRRTDAFFLCRGSLIQEKLVAYAEQFEGLYAMMRGLTAACVLGALTHLGWTTASVLPDRSEYVSGGVVLACLIILAVGKRDWAPRPEASAKGVLSRKGAWAFFVCGLISFALGALFGTTYQPMPGMDHRTVATLVGIAVLLVFVARRTFAEFLRYAGLFAATVYRDFCARPTPEKKA